MSDYSVLPELQLVDINADRVLQKPIVRAPSPLPDDDDVDYTPRTAEARRQGYMMLHRKLKKPMAVSPLFYLLYQNVFLRHLLWDGSLKLVKGDENCS
jgi:hypothetical protein